MQTIVNLTTGQSIPDGVLTAVAWTSERLDEGGWHAPNSSDIVVPSGKYLITVQLGWDTSLTGTRFHHLEVDESGSTRMLAAIAATPTQSFGDTTGNMVVPYMASAAATFRVQVYQDSGGARVFGGDNRPLASAGVSANSEFSVVRLSPSIWTGTAAAYAAIGTKDADTLYVVTG